MLGVNVIGMATLTTALLPSLIRGRGRVIGIGSGAGRIAFPLFAPYATSKFALEGFTDTLRREIARHGVKVVNIQPGIISTPMFDKGCQPRTTCARGSTRGGGALPPPAQLGADLG